MKPNWGNVLNSTVQGAGAGASVGGVWGGVAGGALGLIGGAAGENNQLEEQEELTQQQIDANKNLARYGSSLQMQMWRNTNYPAQVRMLKKAGLNPALMYGMGGGGGTTTGSQTTSGAVGGHAANNAERLMARTQAMGMTLNSIRAKAEIDNLKADTAEKLANAQKTSGADTENVNARTQQVIEETKNTIVAREGIEFDNKIKEIQSIVDSNTAESKITSLKELASQAQLLTNKMRQEVPKAGDTAQAVLDNLKKDLEVKTQDIEKSKAEMEYMSDQIDIAFEQLRQSNVFNLRDYRLEIAKIENDKIRNATYEAYYELEREYKDKQLKWDKERFIAELGGKTMAKLFSGYNPNKGATPKFGTPPPQQEHKPRY